MGNEYAGLLLQIAGSIFNGLEAAFNPLATSDKAFANYISTGWSKFIYEVGKPNPRNPDTIRISCSDYVSPPEEGDRCRRVVVFMAKDAYLTYMDTDCHTPEPAAGLFLHETQFESLNSGKPLPVLRYFDKAALSMDTAGKILIVIRKDEEGVKLEEECKKLRFLLHQGVIYRDGDVEISNCQDLDNMPTPPMFVLSPTGGIGKFKAIIPDEIGWHAVSPWSPLGYVSREYTYGTNCFRLVAITSKGRFMHAIKLTCEPIKGVSISQNSLIIDYALYAQTSTDDKFTVHINTRSKNCWTKEISLTETDDGKVLRMVESDEKIYKANCKHLEKGEAWNPREKIAEKLSNGGPKTFFQDDETLSTFTTFSDSVVSYDWNFEFGIVAQSGWTDTEEEHVVITTFVGAEAIMPVILTIPGIRKIVIEDEKVFYGNELVFSKTKNGFYQVLWQEDGENCKRRQFTVTTYSMYSLPS